MLGLHLSLINHRRLGTSVVPIVLPLDNLAVDVALSTRRLRTAYTGPAVRVRRSSDNAELNINFREVADASGNFGLDTTQLTTFVGSGSGFVTTWYDQSGNGRNAAAGEASRQPALCVNGVVQTLNSRPALLTTASGSRLRGTLVVNGRSNITLNAVTRIVNNTTDFVSTVNNAVISWGETGSWGLVWLAYNSSQVLWRMGTGQPSNNPSQSSALGSGAQVTSIVKQGASENVWVNGNPIGGVSDRLTTLANNRADFTLMNSTLAGGSGPLAGSLFSEVVISSLSGAALSGLEANQLTAYRT